MDGDVDDSKRCMDGAAGDITLQLVPITWLLVVLGYG